MNIDDRIFCEHCSKLMDESEVYLYNDEILCKYCYNKVKAETLTKLSKFFDITFE